MLNGDGLRVVLFVSGCEHHCADCHNPQTWNPDSGKPFGLCAFNEIVEELQQEHISGITLTGGEPLHKENLCKIKVLMKTIKELFPDKTIWLYTGYIWEDIYSFNTKDKDSALRRDIIGMADVLVDGKFDLSLADINYAWAGSRNQRVIDVQESLISKEIVLYSSER